MGQQTVDERFGLDVDKIYVRSKASEYWCSVSEFYDQVKDRPVSRLTTKQEGWLFRIKNDLEKDD